MTALVAERVNSEGVPVGPVRRRTQLLPISLTAGALLLAVVALLAAPDANPDGYGLLPSVPPLYLVAVSVLIAVFLGTLLLRRASTRVLNLQVIALVVMLALAPVLLEHYARFPTAWTHVGFVQYISQHGRVLHQYDARFSWPGFFAMSAAFSKAAGVEPASLLQWTPLVLDLLYLLPLAALTRSFISSPARRAVVLFVFTLANWMGQDYFSPQGLNFLLFLIFMAILVRVFPTDAPSARLGRFACWVTRRDSSAVPEPAVYSSRAQAGWLAALLVVFAASVVSHQLTPFFMLFAATVLALFGSIRLRSLPILLAVLLTAYFIWGAADYWQGHLNQLLGGVGDLSSSLQQNVSGRASASDPARRVVVYSRLLITAAAWLVAVFAMWRSRARTLVVPAALAVTPFLVLGLQSYGGEAILRAELFALPFIAILVAQAFPSPLETPIAAKLKRPTLLRRSRTSILVALVLMVSAVAPVGFVLARYGNESFEETMPGDVAAVRALYRLAPAGATLFSLNDALPWKDQSFGSYAYANLPYDLWSSSDATQVLASMGQVRDAYLIVSDAQWAEARELDSISAPSVAEAQHLIRTTHLLKRVWGSGNTAIYKLAGASS